MRRYVALIAGVLGALGLVLLGALTVQAQGIKDTAGEPQPVPADDDPEDAPDVEPDDD